FWRWPVGRRPRASGTASARRSSPRGRSGRRCSAGRGRTTESQRTQREETQRRTEESEREELHSSTSLFPSSSVCLVSVSSVTLWFVPLSVLPQHRSPVRRLRLREVHHHRLVGLHRDAARLVLDLVALLPARP